MSNRDRVNKAFELLATGLDHFITRAVEAELPEGKDWTVLLAAKDARGTGGVRTYDRNDPQCSLRVITEGATTQVRPGFRPFSQIEQALARELRETRNAWAHNAAFTGDDTYRALDSAERLLRAAGDPAGAEEVKRLRVELRRITSEQEDRRATKSTGVTQVASDTLPPWRQVLSPHGDVADGNFHAAEFAADLHSVSRGDGDAEYTDPVEFFRRTFLTTGLQDLLRDAVARLGGDRNAKPVINLQTNFGGGKTHSMLALWHLASGRPLTDFPQELQDLLTGLALPPRVRRVALVGNQIAPSGLDRKQDGTHVRTLWGELAWQLGGPEGYAMLAEADRTSTAPGEALGALFTRFGPAVILIDEWVAYARQLRGRDELAGGSFETQFTFAQSLTETAKAVPGILVLISIPASSDATVAGEGISDEEVGGENGREALLQLQNAVRRVAEPWRAASADESFEIVRRRLFATPDATQLAQIRATATAMVEYYRRHPSDFPAAVTDSTYIDRIRRSYPVHPELFDRLYEDWSTLDRFQRTRGVLRLMNTVVGQLWRDGDAAPLIMPGSVPLHAPSVLTEISQYLDDRWKPIVDADVDGPGSSPAQVDNANQHLGARHTTRRLARTVFIGATPTLSTAHRGLDRSRVFLGTALPGDVPGNFHSALSHLANTATYFYSSDTSYWFDTQANTTRAARDYADGLHPEDVYAEVKRRLEPLRRSYRQGFASVHVFPDTSAEISDEQQVRLVIVPASHTFDRKKPDTCAAVTWATDVVMTRGAAARVYRTMVVFLAADAARWAELNTAVREHLAWTHLRDNIAVARNLTGAQVEQARERAVQTERTVSDRLANTFHWALIPDQQPTSPLTIRPLKTDGSTDNIAERTATKLRADSALSLQRAAANIRIDLDGPLKTAWNRTGHLSFGELWTWYATYPYLARLRDRSVLADGVSHFDAEMDWRQDSFALATGWDGDRYTGLVVPGLAARTPDVTDSLLLVQPERALNQQQRDAERVANEPPVGEPSASAPTQHTAAAPADQPAAPSPPTPAVLTHFYGVKTLNSERYGGDFSKLAQEVIAQLAAVEGVQLEVRVEITAHAPRGFDEAKVRTVRENATVLKFDDVGFEQI